MTRLTALVALLLSAACVGRDYPDDHTPELDAAVAAATGMWAAVGVTAPSREEFTIGFAAGADYSNFCAESGGLSACASIGWMAIVINVDVPAAALTAVVAHELGHLINRHPGHLHCERTEHLMCRHTAPDAAPDAIDAAFVTGR